MFIGYEGDILEVISNLPVSGVKFGGKKKKLAEKSVKKLNFAEFTDFVFFKSGHHHEAPDDSHPILLGLLPQHAQRHRGLRCRVWSQCSPTTG